MPEERKLKKPTRTYFDAVGTIEFKQEDYFPNQIGKNNPNYTYSRLMFYLKHNEQKTRINLIGGFTPETKIYCLNDTNETIIINFADRGNEELIKQVSTINLFQIGLGKIDVPKVDRLTNEVIMKNGQPEMVKIWNYQNYLAEYDLINFLGQNISNGMRVRIIGEITYDMYADQVQKNYKINKIYFLTEDEKFDDRFTLRVETLIDKNSLDKAEPIVQGDNEYKIKINSKIFHQVNKNKRKIIPLDIFYVYKEEDKDKVNRLIKKLFKIENNTIRKLTVECSLFSGRVYNQPTSDQLTTEITPELQDLIDSGYYTKEEILRKANPGEYSETKFVEEIRFEKPSLIKKDGVISLSIDDEFYVLDDLINLEITKDRSDEWTSLSEEEHAALIADIDDLFGDN